MDPDDPIGDLTRVHGQNLDRTMAEHNAAGVQESASQKFYGGEPTTRIPDAALQAAHNSGVMMGRNKFLETVGNIERHPEFQANTEDLTPEARHQAAHNVTAQASADTSPQNKYREPGTGTWPNIQQAEESAIAGIEGRDPAHISGLPANDAKATSRVRESLYKNPPGGNVHEYGNQVSSAKVVAFRGAEIDQDSPDAYVVGDLHEGKSTLPGTSSSKAKAYMDPSTGKRVMHFPDQPDSHIEGMEQVTHNANGGKLALNNRAQQMQSDSKSTWHALNDLATRRALSARGLSRGVDYTDNSRPGAGGHLGSRAGAPWRRRGQPRQPVSRRPRLGGRRARRYTEAKRHRPQPGWDIR